MDPIRSLSTGFGLVFLILNVFQEASDVILLDDDFSTILSSIEEGKSIFYNIRSLIIDFLLLFIAFVY